jgi:hypothetical protein
MSPVCTAIFGWFFIYFIYNDATMNIFSLVFHLYYHGKHLTTHRMHRCIFIASICYEIEIPRIVYVIDCPLQVNIRRLSNGKIQQTICPCYSLNSYTVRKIKA